MNMPKHYKSAWSWGACLLLAVLLLAGSLGCSTFPDPYIPAQTGPVRPAPEIDGLVLDIAPVHDQHLFKHPVTFKVVLRNQGDRAYWLPRRPHILFYWVYPNGVRDHYVRQLPASQFLDDRDVVLLKPGHQLVYTEYIETFYFPKRGIMEFRAQYVSLPNTNPLIAPFWSGRLQSNTYGLLLN